MKIRTDLSYEKSKTEIPYIFTGANDIDEAISIAKQAIWDAESFREYARATGTDVVERGISVPMAVCLFLSGIVACLLFLWLFGAI